MNKGIQNIIIAIVVMVLAVLMGNWVITDPEIAGVAIALSAALGLFFTLGKNVWILIIVGGSLGVSFPFIPGGFSTKDLSLIFVIGCAVLLLVTSRISIRLKMSSLEWMALIIILFVLQAYMRNPVGVNAFGSEYVGGRPYLSFILSVAAGWVLASTKTDLATIRRLYWLSLLGMGISACIHVAAHVSGTIASYTGRFFGVYGKLGDISTGPQTVDDGRAGRNSAGSQIARSGSRWLASCSSPLRALFHPFWFGVLLMVLVGAGISGYRNVIASTVMTLALATYYWGGGRAVMKATFISIGVYFLINVVNLVHPLPASIQRSLSFLPGTWEQAHI